MRNGFCLKGLPACPAVLGKIKRDKPYEKIYFKNSVGCLSCVRRGGLRCVFFLRKIARRNKNRTAGRRFDSRRFDRRFEKQSFGRRNLDSARERITLQISEAFRSYDVIDVMSEATTLDRLSYILKSAKGIVNAETSRISRLRLVARTGLCVRRRAKNTYTRAIVCKRA